MLQSQKREEFRLELRNRFEPLELLENDVETHWNQVKEVFTSTCREVLGEKKHEHKPWISQESLDKIEERREKKAELNNSRTRTEKEQARKEYSKVLKEVKKSVKNDKESFLEELAGRAERAAQNGHMRTLYQTTKILTGKRSTPEVPVKDVDGNAIFEKEAQNKRWTEHFEKLLNRPPPNNPPDI